MKIDRTEARRIAALAHLEFDDAGLDRMAGEMTAILDYIEQLREVDADAPQGVVASAMPTREDDPHAPLPLEEVAKNAPAWHDGFFVVPKVIGGE